MSTDPNSQPPAPPAPPGAPPAPPPSAKKKDKAAPPAPPPSAANGDEPFEPGHDVPEPEVDEKGFYETTKKRYYAQTDFEGSVGQGALSTVKLKGPQFGQTRGQEIKDEPLALELIKQGLPVEVVEEKVKLKKTFLDPTCPKTGRWEHRPGATKVDTVEPPEQKPEEKSKN